MREDETFVTRLIQVISFVTCSSAFVKRSHVQLCTNIWVMCFHLKQQATLDTFTLYKESSSVLNSTPWSANVIVNCSIEL